MKDVFSQGFRKVEDIFRKIGILVLTSISEALPLVILEGFANGVPAVATDVGSCRELIEGGRPEDKELGMAGAVVPIDADPVPEMQADEKLAGGAAALQEYKKLLGVTFPGEHRVVGAGNTHRTVRTNTQGVRGIGCVLGVKSVPGPVSVRDLDRH